MQMYVRQHHPPFGAPCLEISSTTPVDYQVLEGDADAGGSSGDVADMPDELWVSGT